MIFYNTSAPTGWTQVTTYNDYTLRVVNGTGGGTGGTDSISSPPVHNHGTPTENPTTDLSHTHTITVTSVGFRKNGAGVSALVEDNPPTTQYESSGDIDHTHVMPSHDTVGFSPKYIDSIICYR